MEKLNVENSRVKVLFDECVEVVRYTNDTNSKWFIYDNQIETAKEIIYSFYTQQNRWCLLFAEMQAGKSGTFFSVPYIISRNKLLLNKLKIDMIGSEINVFLLTGMNEKELIDQFETDISSYTGMDIKKNIFHNNEMQKFLVKNKNLWTNDDLNIVERMKRNSLILIDESHYGSDKQQVLNKFLTTILNISPNGDNKELEKNNQYVVSISATPMAEFIKANLSEFKKKIIPLKNADGYSGISEMFKNNKIHKSYDLKDVKSVDFFIDKIMEIKKVGYVLVRCTEPQKQRIIKRMGERLVEFKTIDYDQYNKSRLLNNMGINDLLSQQPSKTTLIFLKNLLRAGKRVDTKNIIMTHDTSESNTDTTVQSLLGRCCGYNKNKEIEIFCDKQSALKYKNWIESDYDIKLIPDNSKNVPSGFNKISIETKHESILFDIKENELALDILSKPRKSKEEKFKILRSLNHPIINGILDENNYDIGTIFKVDKNKDNTSYQKQYLDVINSRKFMGDYKPLEGDIGKTIFSASFEEDEKKIVVSFGNVVMIDPNISDKSMYHENNKIGCRTSESTLKETTPVGESQR